MVRREDNAQAITGSIRQVLLSDWDPIGVANDPDCPQDEYDPYIGGVCRLLVDGSSVLAIALHLRHIEENRMGVGPASIESLIRVAGKLAAIDISSNVA